MAMFWSTIDTWFESHQGLITVVFGLLGAAFGLPALVQSIRGFHDRGRTSDEIADALRRTGGRVNGPRLQSEAIGSENLLPIQVRIEDAAATDGVQTVLSTLGTGESILVVGEGGAGKSEMLHQVHLASYRSSDRSVPLVEVLSLASFPGGRGGRQGVLAWATKQVAARYRRSHVAVRRLVDETRIVFAFDALDEAPESVRHEIVSQVSAWSETHPTVVTSRVTSSPDTETQSPEDVLGSARRVRTARMQPFDREQVVAALEASPATDLPALIDDAGSFANPLRLQLLLFTARQRALEPDEVEAIVTDSHALLARVIRGVDGRAGVPDPALRFAGVLSADIEKGQGAAFRLVPFAFSGTAFWVARLLMLPLLAWLGVFQGYAVSSIALGVALLLSSPYERQSPVNRALLALAPRASEWVRFAVRLVLAFVLVHIVRIGVWSFDAGTFTPGERTEFLDLYWVGAVIWCFLIHELSPFSTVTVIGYTRYLRTHAWPQFVALAIFAAYAVVLGPWVGALAVGLLVNTAATCSFLVVSFFAAWAASGVAPWRWRSTADQLVRRGVLSRSGRRYKFVHADLEQHLLWEAASDATVPRLLWRLYGRHWTERMLSRRLGRTGARPGRGADRVVDLLSRRFAWSDLVHNDVMPYFSWTRLAPGRALAAARRHDRSSHGRGRDPRLADALDRAHDPRGLERALRAIPQAASRFEATWLLMVLERHGDDVRVREVLTRFARREPTRTRRGARRMDPGVSGFLASRSASALASPSTEADTTEELIAWCRRLKDAAPTLAIANARIAQAAHHSGAADAARSIALFAASTIVVREVYAGMVEVMLTAAVLADDPVAEGWLDDAVASGLTVIDREGLARRLPTSRWAGLLVEPWGAVESTQRAMVR